MDRTKATVVPKVYCANWTSVWWRCWNKSGPTIGRVSSMKWSVLVNRANPFVKTIWKSWVCWSKKFLIFQKKTCWVPKSSKWNNRCKVNLAKCLNCVNLPWNVVNAPRWSVLLWPRLPVSCPGSLCPMSLKHRCCLCCAHDFYTYHNLDATCWPCWRKWRVSIKQKCNNRNIKCCCVNVLWRSWIKLIKCYLCNKSISHKLLPMGKKKKKDSSWN